MSANRSRPTGGGSAVGTTEAILTDDMVWYCRVAADGSSMAHRYLRPGWEIFLQEHSGEKLAIVVPCVTDDMDPHERESAVRQRIMARTGRCPCDATVDARAWSLLAARLAREVMVTIMHRGCCPIVGGAGGHGHG